MNCRTFPRSASLDLRKLGSRIKFKERIARLPANLSASALKLTAFTPCQPSRQSRYRATARGVSRSRETCCRMSWCGTLGWRNRKAWRTSDRMMGTRAWSASKPAASAPGTISRRAMRGKVDSVSQHCHDLEAATTLRNSMVERSSRRAKVGTDSGEFRSWSLGLRIHPRWFGEEG